MSRPVDRRLFGLAQIPRPSWTARFRDNHFGGLLHTRASTGTYWDAYGLLQTAAADAARIAHDPSNGKTLGALIEDSRTNLLTYSEQFDNAAWTKTRLSAFGSGSSVNAITAPDGTVTGEFVNPDTTNSTHEITQSFAKDPTPRSYANSVFLQGSDPDYSWQFFDIDDGGAANRITAINHLDVQTVNIGPTASGTFTTPAAGYVRAPGNWRRPYLAGTTSTGPTVRFRHLVVKAVLTAYVGDAGRGHYLWGGQTEEGGYPTSYIPTTAAAVTRARDELSGNFAPASYGTLAITFRSPIAPTADTRTLWQLDDASGNNRIRLQISGGVVQAIFTAAGSTLATLNLGAVSEYQDCKAVIAWAPGQCAGSLNGGAVASASLASVPSTGYMRVGHDHSFANYLNGPVAQIDYWDRPLTPNLLQVASRV